MVVKRKLVSICLEIVLISSQDRCTEWKLVLVRFKIVLVSAKDRCTVCAECNSGMEIALGTPEWYSKVMFVKF